MKYNFDQFRSVIGVYSIETPREGKESAEFTPAPLNSLTNWNLAFYSGTIFEYKIVGSRVTLEKGFGAKNGTSNIYSDLFRANLVEMNNIYASMSPTQREAWMKLRIKGLLNTVISWITSSPEELVKGYIKDALIDMVIPTDEIEALIYGCRSWYRVEQSAI